MHLKINIRTNIYFQYITLNPLLHSPVLDIFSGEFEWYEILQSRILAYRQKKKKKKKKYEDIVTKSVKKKKKNYVVPK